ncbi:ABC transporter ATP-binding protein [Desulfoplanes formicivorans]|uniref:ABC transporter n=1 Tax=Desulfoplanes formicivorans TaxID=1592317 RepID=A0A194AFA2_9BACT|nr:ABC transporter ATP-binding protein [Desulfoplanes formicivorans]GAU08747.1 ABC transporter [Desulfoplanes formicivorans]
MTSALATRHLAFSYNGTRVLHNITLDIPRGSLFTIIGPNGSGKTTLLRLLAGLCRPLSGHILLNGRELQRFKRRLRARTLAIVPQSLPQSFPFTVQQAVLMARAPRQGLLGFETRTDLDMAQNAMRYTGVDHLAHKSMDRISGGERQRAFIARALCQEPDILLLDEPTAALDYAHQIRIMDLLADLRATKGTTIVLVSHDLNLSSMYADHILLLHQGKVACQGSPEQVLQSAILEPAYGCRLFVDTHPQTGRPRIMPMPGNIPGHRASTP